MSFFGFLGKFAANKAKDFINDVLTTMDLDHNSVPDKVQWEAWADSLGTIGSRVDEAIDQDKLMAAVKDGAKTVKEIAAYIEAVEHQPPAK